MAAFINKMNLADLEQQKAPKITQVKSKTKQNIKLLTNS